MRAASLDRGMELGGTIALRVFAVLIVAFIVTPLVVIVVGSFSDRLYLTFPPPGLGLLWYHELVTQPRWFAAAWNTVSIGVLAALVSVALGTISALAVARGRARWLAGLGAFFLAPMMLPHVIIAIGLYPTMLDFGLANTYAAVVFAHVVVATPVVFLTVTSALKGYGEAIEMAARTLGANEWKLFARVTFPMIRSGMAVGGIFAFATSFDELMLSLFLTGPRTETLPILIWEHLFFTLTPVVAVVATLILAASIALLTAALLIGRTVVDPIASHVTTK